MLNEVPGLAVTSHLSDSDVNCLLGRVLNTKDVWKLPGRGAFAKMNGCRGCVEAFTNLLALTINAHTWVGRITSI